MERIEAGVLIPGQGNPVYDGVVLLDVDRISYASGHRTGHARRGDSPRSRRHAGAVGLPRPLEAIKAATAIAPQTLGPQAPRSGQLVAGYDADVITLSADPLADIMVLTDQAKVVGVWSGGRQVKGSPAP